MNRSVRILVHVEGQTEETFVKDVLSGHLQRGGIIVQPRLLGNQRLRKNRGGIRPWRVVASEIVRHLKDDPQSFATTMVDYYGLPCEGTNAWPGRAAAATQPLGSRAKFVQDAMMDDIRKRMGARFKSGRFVPFVLMHEFEALLFSDCKAFANGLCQPHLEEAFSEVLSSFDNPEEINDSPDTAPSKRITAIVTNYEKPLHGNLAILEIGLATIRSKCPNFNEWLSTLETLVADQ